MLTLVSVCVCVLQLYFVDLLRGDCVYVPSTFLCLYAVTIRHAPKLANEIDTIVNCLKVNNFNIL